MCLHSLRSDADTVASFCFGKAMPRTILASMWWDNQMEAAHWRSCAHVAAPTWDTSSTTVLQRPEVNPQGAQGHEPRVK